MSVHAYRARTPEEYAEILQAEGASLASAADRAGPDTPLPSCPGWRVADLLAHTGAVHRWAAGHLSGEAAVPPYEETEKRAPRGPEALPWYVAAHRHLLDVLRAAPPDLDCWYFFGAPSGVEFWSRRQVHETTMHRVDMELALGAGPSPVAPDLAADGVDELLVGFHGRQRSRVRTELPRTLRICAPDVAGAQWLVHLSDAPPRTVRAGAAEGGAADEEAADCTVSAPAERLYLTLWNRGSYEDLSVDGDATLVDLWRRTGAIG
jgi:uncharacterized protein (TIGR03083 family)